MAQKSIRTTLPASSALVIVRVLSGPSSRVKVKSGAGWPSLSFTREFLFLAAVPLLHQRIDLGESLGGFKGEQPILRDLGFDRARGPAELLDRDRLPGRNTACESLGVDLEFDPSQQLGCGIDVHADVRALLLIDEQRLTAGLGIRGRAEVNRQVVPGRPLRRVP